jgi:transcriptional regulator GlxA family with amidase domain
MAAECGAAVKAVTVADTARTVRCAKRLKVVADHGFADAPKLDVLLVPGGMGTRREVGNPKMLDWIRRTAAGCSWVTSVCTGALLLAGAGVVRGRRYTTHWAFADQLDSLGEGKVMRNARYIADGNLVTAAGVSAGIDMALWLTGQIFGDELARRTQKYMEYEPAPPYDVTGWVPRDAG